MKIKRHPVFDRHTVSGAKSNAASKVDTIVKEITGRIEAGEWNAEERLPSRNQFACAYDVSPQTISLVMQRLQQSGLLYVVPNRGVFMCEATAMQHGKILYPPIGIRGSYVPTVLQDKRSKGYNLLLVRAIWEAAQQVHAPIMLLSSQTKTNKLTPSYCKSLGLKGIIFIGGDTHGESEQLRNAGISAILANEPFAPTPMNYVDYDHAGVLREIIGRFVACGHRNIAVIATNSSVDSFYNKFKPVYIDTLCEHGIEKNFNRYWRFVEPDLLSDDPWCTAAEAALELMDLPDPPTALFVFSHMAAKSVQLALQAAGKSISIATSGYCSEEYAELSGFIQQHDELGRQLLEGIHRSLENPLHFCQQTVPLKFIDKGTIHQVTPAP